MELAAGSQSESGRPRSGPEAPHRAAPSSESSSVAPEAPTYANLTQQRVRLELEHPEFGPMPTLVHVPARTDPDQRLPVLIAFHGMGESKKGPERGALGWFEDYALDTTLRRLEQPPLTRQDFEGFVANERLQEINERLETRPYRPLIVVTPYLPDVLGGPQAFENAPALARFVVSELLPQVVAVAPAQTAASATGIDGVSLGGRAALLIGFAESTAFGAIGALQAAVDEQEIPEFAERARAALQKNPELAVRLVSSWGDYYLDVNRQLHRAFERSGVPSEFLLAHGTHSYQFNRGPGGYEMLLFHESALRRP